MYLYVFLKLERGVVQPPHTWLDWNLTWCLIGQLLIIRLRPGHFLLFFWSFYSTCPIAMLYVSGCSVRPFTRGASRTSVKGPVNSAAAVKNIWLRRWNVLIASLLTCLWPADLESVVFWLSVVWRLRGGSGTMNLQRSTPSSALNFCPSPVSSSSSSLCSSTCVYTSGEFFLWRWVSMTTQVWQTGFMNTWMFLQGDSLRWWWWRWWWSHLSRSYKGPFDVLADESSLINRWWWNQWNSNDTDLIKRRFGLVFLDHTCSIGPFHHSCSNMSQQGVGGGLIPLITALFCLRVTAVHSVPAELSVSE